MENVKDIVKAFFEPVLNAAIKNSKDEKKKDVDNEKVDKRKLIDEVGGILKGKVDDEIIRTVMKKMEEASYNDSEKSADNKKIKNEEDKKEDVENKKVKNEDEADKDKVAELKEDVKEDVDNKCKNSKTDFFEEMNKVYNSAQKQKEETTYISRADRLKAAEEYFKV